MPDGELIILVDGVEQRTITATHAQQIKDDKFELEKLREALPIAQQEIAQLRSSLTTALKQVESADNIARMAQEQTKTQEKIAEQWKAQYEASEQLRLSCDKLVGRGGRVGEFFDRWYMQLLTKGGLQAANLWLSSRK